MTDWGPTGELVYNRTYSRPKADGSRETWPETVRRVVDGNLALVPERHQLPEEREDLISLMEEFKVIPAGRQLWATGVRGRQYLYNCFVSGWGKKPSDHFEFTFMRLMEGGGVGANYSNHLLDKYPSVKQFDLRLHIVCDPDHPDYEDLKKEHLLSREYVDDWEGCYQVEDSREGWAAALVDLIDTHYRYGVKHANRVYDVSRVRASGTKLRTYGGYASGPVPLARMLHRVAKVLDAASSTVLRRNRGDGRLSGMDAMEIDHAIAECVVAGGNRRSARMAIMHWADPQIREFLNCKRDTGKHWTTNISVEIDERFVRGIIHNDGPYEPDIDEQANDVLYAVAEGMLENGEPGIWNSSLSNEGEPNPVQATNPCGEIPLEPWEACNLGHVNLSAFVDERGELDEDRLAAAHVLMTRFLIRSTFGDRNDPKQAEVMDRNRRIGLGHFGFAEFAHLLGYSYAEADNQYICELLEHLARIVDNEAVRFAHDLRIPVPVKKRTVAPTGTIAKMPGTSEGIHPIFAKHFLRRIRFSTVDPEQFATATEYAAKGYNVVPDVYADNTVVVEIPTEDIVYNKVARIHGEAEADRIVQSPDELTLDDMLGVQEMYQSFWADNAVSYTANIDPEKYTVQDIVDALTVHLDELKGVTLFPELSRPLSPYERLTKEEFQQYSNSTLEDSVDEECATGACPVR